MLKPMPSAESPVTSPEMGRRRYNYYNANIINAPPPPPPIGKQKLLTNILFYRKNRD